MSNGNAAAAVLVTAAIITGMTHAHGGRRHGWARQSSSPERVELGDARIPVRSVRASGRRSSAVAFTGKSATVEPEVIVGYVNPHHGRAAFHRLARMVEGDRVKVVRKDHSVAWYTVDSVGRGVRPHRPAGRRPELRLISWRHPDEQRVVVAHPDRS